MPYSPLGKGFLTGTIDATTSFADNDIRITIPRFTAEARQANHALVDLLAKMSKNPLKRLNSVRPSAPILSIDTSVFDAIELILGSSGS